MKKKKITLMLSLILGCTLLIPSLTYAASNGWTKSQGKWYFYENGNKKSGWLQEGGCWYYLNGDGTMATGWKQVNNTWYYLNSDGSMKTGWLNDSGTWYYLNDDGSMAIGWKKVNDTWYYLNSDGSMKTGWLNDGGCWYYLNADGSMAHDTTVDECYLDTDGRWVTSGAKEQEEYQEPYPDDVQEIEEVRDYNFIEALNKFAINSSSEVLTNQNKEENNLYSPMSVFMALSVLSEGAANDTRDEMLKTLDLSFVDGDIASQYSKLTKAETFDEESGKCQFANSIWLNNNRSDVEFKEKTLNKISKEYGADIFKEDFTKKDDIADKISKWISEKTYGVLGGNPKDFEINDPDAMMEIFNTVYFKDKWEDPFYEGNTKKDKFYLSNGNAIETDFMNKSENNYIYTKENQYEISSLEFEQGCKMAFILPEKSKSTDDILKNKSVLEEAVNHAAKIKDEGKMYDVVYKVPKFKYTLKMNLNDTLKKLGLECIYSDKADFSNFTDSTDLKVSDVKQGAGVTVEENGAEAAAYTQIEVTEACSCIPEQYETKEFILDRPFIFTILDKDNNVMFMGVINNPTK